MIIDFHTHIFPDAIADRVIEKLEQAARSRAFIRATADCLLDSMKESGVDCSVILPVVTSPKQFDTINKTALLTNEEHGEEGLLSFGGIHPADPDYRAHLKQIAESGLKGIKLHPVYQGVNFDDPQCMDLVDYASELGLIISIHAGTDIGVPGEFADPVRIRRVIDTVHPKKLVLAHLGGWNQYELVEELLVGQDVYLDTAFALGRPYKPIDEVAERELPDLCMPEQFARIVKNHGADKILFATDSPWSGQKESLEVLRNMPISQKEKDLILGENARALLGL